MNEHYPEDTFSSALRSVMVARVDASAPLTRRRLRKRLHRGLWLGTYTRTATVDLGAAPDGATNIAGELTCLTPGLFALSDRVTITADPAASWIT